MTDQKFRQKMIEAANTYTKLAVQAKYRNNVLAIGACAFSIMDSIIPFIPGWNLLLNILLHICAVWFIYMAFSHRRMARIEFEECMERRQDVLDDLWNTLK